MPKYYLLVAALISTALAFMYFRVGVPEVYPSYSIRSEQPHAYDDAHAPISHIQVLAFYFVPNNKVSSISSNWKPTLAAALSQLQQFHSLQFAGSSQLTFQIFPQPVVGLYDNLSYDTDSTDGGNPEALRRVSAELESRVLNPKGVLYNAEFATAAPAGTRRSIMILYEGIGASASGQYGMTSIKFFQAADYALSADTIFAHEFYHTLGLPDHYTPNDAKPTSEDIMGAARFSPLSHAFIDRETLKKMGL